MSERERGKGKPRLWDDTMTIEQQFQSTEMFSDTGTPAAYSGFGSWPSIVDSLPVAVIGVDRDEIVVLANPSVERVLGLDRCLLLGNSLCEVLPEEVAHLVRPVAEGSSAARSDLLMIDGRLVKVECVPLGSDDAIPRRGALLVAYVMEDIACQRTPFKVASMVKGPRRQVK